MNTPDPLLSLGLVLLLILVLVSSLYFLAYWQHPEDKNESFFAKIVIIIGFFLSISTILILPIDVGNNMGSLYCDDNSPMSVGSNSFCGYLDIKNVWISFFFMIIFLVIVCIPFSIFFYESFSENPNDSQSTIFWIKFREALGYEIMVIIVFSAMLIGLYFMRSNIEIPIEHQTFSLFDLKQVNYTRNTIEVYDINDPIYTDDQREQYTSSFLNNGLIYVDSPYDFFDMNIPKSEFYDLELLKKNTTLNNFLNNHLNISEPIISGSALASTPNRYEDDWIMPSEFLVYLIGFFCFLGYFLFMIFLGVGLTITPLEYFFSYYYRPINVSPDVLTMKELELKERTNDILELLVMMKKNRTVNTDNSESKGYLKGMFSHSGMKDKLSDRLETNKVTMMVYVLERDLEDFKLMKTFNQDYNPLRPYFHLFLSLFFGALSILWWLQFLLSTLMSPPVSPFLSLFFSVFDLFFPMFGVIFYSLFSLYILYATVNGCFRLTLRLGGGIDSKLSEEDYENESYFSCFMRLAIRAINAFLSLFECCTSCISIHPMKVGGTYTNSFLFNLAVVLFCSISILHLCVTSFQGYTVDTGMI